MTQKCVSKQKILTLGFAFYVRHFAICEHVTKCTEKFL
jgi:hypothetical protein